MKIMYFFFYKNQVYKNVRRQDFKNMLRTLEGFISSKIYEHKAENPKNLRTCFSVFFLINFSM